MPTPALLLACLPIQIEFLPLDAVDASASAYFGCAVAVDGEWAVVGASRGAGEEPPTGAAYVYRRSGGAWIEAGALEHPPLEALAQFGAAVDVDGDLMAIGMPGKIALLDPSIGTLGSVHLYRFDGQAWTHEAELFGSDIEVSEAFGTQVAIDGDRVVVAARHGDGPEDDSGAAYVFRREAGAWIETAKLTGSDTLEGSGFGSALAIEGDTIAVGAWTHDLPVYQAGAVYVFGEGAGGWVEQARLTAADADESDRLGRSVALDGGRLFAGAQLDDEAGTDHGAVYEFARDDGGTPGLPGDDSWLQTAKILPTIDGGHAWCGWSLAVHGDELAAGGPKVAGGSHGAVWTFAFDGVAWSQTAQLVAPDPQSSGSDAFGISIGLDGGELLVGARDHDAQGAESGSATFFASNGAGWAFDQLLLEPGVSAVGRMGHSVAVDVSRAAVGAPGDATAGRDAGSVYLFDAAADGSWSLEAKLSASGAARGDRFGVAVAVEGDWVLAGASHDDVVWRDQGSARLFERSIAGWIEAATWTGFEAAADDHYGAAVAIDGDLAAVGVPGSDAAAPDAGAVEVWRNQGGVWVRVALLTANDAMAGDALGTAVAIADDRVYAGAPRRQTGLGAIYGFRSGAMGWMQMARIEPTGGHRWDGFGSSVGAWQDLLIAGAPSAEDAALGDGQGAAWIFRLVDDQWVQEQRLLGSIVDPNPFPFLLPGDAFGSAVAIENGVALVGAPRAIGSEDGGAYLFVETPHGWVESDFLPPQQGATIEHFGAAVAMEGGRALIGAPRASDFVTSDVGRAYVADLLPYLAGGPAQLSLAGGATADFELVAGPEHSGAVYVLLGSLTGTAPVTVIDGLDVPLVSDPYFLLTADGPGGATFEDFVGRLDSAGRARAALHLPPSAATLAGSTVHHAFVVLSPASIGIADVSGARSIELAP